MKGAFCFIASGLVAGLASAQSSCFPSTVISTPVSDTAGGQGGVISALRNVWLAAAGTDRVAVIVGPGVSAHATVWVTTDGDPSAHRFLDRQFHEGVSISVKQSLVQSALFDWPLDAFQSGLTGFPSGVAYNKISSVLEPDSLLLAVNGADVPDLDAKWQSLRHARVSDGGTPFWVGSMDATLDGLDLTDSLVTGSAAEINVVLSGGDVLPNGKTLTQLDPFIAFSLAPDGNSALAHVRTVTGEDTGSAVVLANVEPHDISLIAEQGGQVGRLGPGWNWSRFGPISLTERAWNCGIPTWFVAGEATSRHGQSWIIVRDGEIILQEGQKFCEPSFYIRGPVFAIDSNSSGDLASIWTRPNVDGVNGVQRTAPILLVNDIPVLACGAALPATPSHSFRRVAHLFPTVAISDRTESGTTSIYVHALIAYSQEALLEGIGIPEVLRINVELGPDNYCVVDFNDDGVVNQHDLTLFVLAWIERAVDMNCDGTTDDSDLSEFLRLWQAGSC